MKLLVFGHSNSDGTRLADPADAWPQLVCRDVEAASGQLVESVHRRLVPGPTALSYLERQLEREQPDVVILCLSSYTAAVRLSSNRVRERFGERAGRIVQRGEEKAQQMSESFGPRGRKLLLVSRRGARRLLGTKSGVQLDELVGTYADCFRALARRESVSTVIFSGTGYSAEIQHLNPGVNELQDRMDDALKVIADELHFDWLGHEAILGGSDGKLQYFQADGVHTNEAGQRLAAKAVLPLVLARL